MGANSDGFYDAASELPEKHKGGAVAIGNFDGVHRGHQAVLKEALRYARQNDIPAIVLTFEPHPRTWFNPAEPVFRLTPAKMKARLLHDMGFDAVVAEPFDKSLAGQSAEEFVRTHLVEGFGASVVVTGFNFHFGKGRAGTPAFLQQAGVRHGFSVDLVDRFDGEDDERVSSSRIRKALNNGDIATASRLLGRHWRAAGTVVQGARRGREMGFATANLKLPEETQLRHGIYAVRMIRNDERIHDGVASFGRRPTFDNGAPLLETHLFDFDDDLYGEEIEIAFAGWIRPEEKFANAEALVDQMKRDCSAARTILAAEPLRD